jgi:hypothetical protein
MHCQPDQIGDRFGIQISPFPAGGSDPGGAGLLVQEAQEGLQAILDVGRRKRHGTASDLLAEAEAPQQDVFKLIQVFILRTELRIHREEMDVVQQLVGGTVMAIFVILRDEVLNQIIELGLVFRPEILPQTIEMRVQDHHQLILAWQGHFSTQAATFEGWGEIALVVAGHHHDWKLTTTHRNAAHIHRQGLNTGVGTWLRC